MGYTRNVFFSFIRTGYFPWLSKLWLTNVLCHNILHGRKVKLPCENFRCLASCSTINVSFYATWDNRLWITALSVPDARTLPLLIGIHIIGARRLTTEALQLDLPWYRWMLLTKLAHSLKMLLYSILRVGLSLCEISSAALCFTLGYYCEKSTQTVEK